MGPDGDLYYLAYAKGELRHIIYATAPNAVLAQATASIQADAQIASNGSGFLMFWSDNDGTRGTRWHWAAVDAAGLVGARWRSFHPDADLPNAAFHALGSLSIQKRRSAQRC